MNDAVALAKIYIQRGDDKSANNIVDKISQIIPAVDKDESTMGSFVKVFKGELYLEKNDYEKVEESILATGKIIEGLGMEMLTAKKERILAELNEKQGNLESALEHYYASIDAPPD